MAYLTCSCGCLIRHLKLNPSKQMSQISLAQTSSCLSFQPMAPQQPVCYSSWRVDISCLILVHCHWQILLVSLSKAVLNTTSVIHCQSRWNNGDQICTLTWNNPPQKRKPIQNTCNNGFQDIDISQWRTVIPEKWKNKDESYSCPSIPLGEFPVLLQWNN